MIGAPKLSGLRVSISTDAGDAAFEQRSVLGLVDNDVRLHHLRRQQGEADAAADGLVLVEDEPVAGGDRVAVDGDLRQAGGGAADADAVVLVEAAFAAGCGFGVHARDALQGVGDVLVRQLADVGGGDGVDLVDAVRLIRSPSAATGGCRAL